MAGRRRVAGEARAGFPLRSLRGFPERIEGRKARPGRRKQGFDSLRRGTSPPFRRESGAFCGAPATLPVTASPCDPGGLQGKSMRPLRENVRRLSGLRLFHAAPRASQKRCGTDGRPLRGGKTPRPVRAPRFARSPPGGQGVPRSCFFSGAVKINRVPSRPLSARRVPRCSWAMRLAMLSPRPKPLFSPREASAR